MPNNELKGHLMAALGADAATDRIAVDLAAQAMQKASDAVTGVAKLHYDPVGRAKTIFLADGGQLTKFFRNWIMMYGEEEVRAYIEILLGCAKEEAERLRSTVREENPLLSDLLDILQDEGSK